MGTADKLLDTLKNMMELDVEVKHLLKRTDVEIITRFHRTKRNYDDYDKKENIVRNC